MTDRPSHIWPSFQEKLSAMDTGLIEKMEVHYQKRAQTLVDVGLVRKDPTKTPLRKAWPGE
jgi:hypothetical protein